MLIGVSFSAGFARIRRSARAFARAPGLLFVLLLTIALGVGSNAAVYGFLQGLTHPAIPLRGTARIVSIFGEDQFREAGALSPDDYRQLRNNRGTFAWTGSARIGPADTNIDGWSEIATVAAVTPNLAEVLAIPLDKGVVISHRIWENEFDGSEKAIGSPIRIGDQNFRIAGVAPIRLEGLYQDQSVDVWIQSNERDFDIDPRDKRNVWVVACLRSDVSLSQAENALRSSSHGLRDVSVVPFTGMAPKMTRGLERVVKFLTFAAGAVFLIACINVASFLLGRALRRSHETSLRIALGATRAEILWDLFADSAVISIAGGVLGLLLGFLTARALPAFLFEEDAERLSFAPHFLPIVAASLVCVAVTVFCGMLPVLGTVTDRPWTVLQRESGSPSKGILRLRSGLVVGQIAACCMLVIGTALLAAGLHSALETNAGHRLGNPILLTVEAQLRRDGPEIDTSFFTEVAQRTKSVTGLSPLAWTARLPGNQPMWRTFRIQQMSAQYRNVTMDIDWLTPDSIQTLDYEPLAGRTFGVNDQRYRVAVVNEDAAAELFGAGTAGVLIRDDANQPIEVLGVVKKKPGEEKEPERPIIYYGYLNQPEAPKAIRNARFRIPVEAPSAGIELSANMVSANYFRALGLPLIAGQAFSESPIPGQGRIGVVNQEAADLYFGGKANGAGVIDDRGVRTEIVGVVRSQVLGIFEQHAEPAIYFPMWQDSPARMTLILKDAKWNRGLAADLLHRIDETPGRGPGPVVITTMDRQLAQSGLAGVRIAILIGGVSAATGLLLSLLGLLSAQEDAERQRQRDRALRLALGAQRWRIVFLVMKSAGQLAFVGTAAGMFLSFAVLRTLLAGITAISSPPVEVWLTAPLLPAAAMLIASMIPARRASAASPAAIMRDN